MLGCMRIVEDDCCNIRPKKTDNPLNNVWYVVTQGATPRINASFEYCP